MYTDHAQSSPERGTDPEPSIRQSSGNPEEDREEFRRQGVSSTTGEHSTAHRINRAGLGLTETEAATPEPAWVCTRSSAYVVVV